MKKIYLRTFGCQMNVRDSEIVRGMLEEQGYKFVDAPEKADIVIFNTCSVREHAEHKAVSILASIARKKPRRIFGLIGCVAAHRKEMLFKTIQRLDFIAGPSEIYHIPEILDKSQKSKVKSQNHNSKLKIAEVDSKTRPIDYVNPSYRERKDHAFVNIMYGCDNYCSYCIVPYVRGKEVSRPAKDIVIEIEGLVKNDIRNITLLGQNVNSYGKVEIASPPAGARNDAPCNFINLLKKINEIEGIEKVGFMTSHPKDASIELFKAIKDLEHVKKELHLPLQSGSNKILKLMNRGYALEKYRDLIDNYRKILPNGKLTTDIIVGFPNETEEDFSATKKAMEEIKFDAAYIFKYSPRPPAKSSEIKDDVPLEIKKKRNNELLKIVKEHRRNGK